MEAMLAKQSKQVGFTSIMKFNKRDSRSLHSNFSVVKCRKIPFFFQDSKTFSWIAYLRFEFTQHFLTVYVPSDKWLQIDICLIWNDNTTNIFAVVQAFAEIGKLLSYVQSFKKALQSTY